MEEMRCKHETILCREIKIKDLYLALPHRCGETEYTKREEEER